MDRLYRLLHSSKDLVHFNLRLGETDLDIGAKKPLKEEALILVEKYRREIEGYIENVPEFLTSLSPLPYREDAPAIVRDMLKAAEKAKVGPMAAVAGAISQYVGKGLLKFSREIIVENGGDIFIKSSKERIIGVYAGKSLLSGKVGIRIDPKDCPIGICTSSGKIGHALSFGNGDAIMVMSKDTALADAVATAVGNRVKRVEDIQETIDFAREIEGVEGAMVIMEDRFGVWGNIELVKL